MSWTKSHQAATDRANGILPIENDGRSGRKPRRKFPVAKIGDAFGDRIVTEILPRDSTSNERVETKCRRCGDRRASYVFNLRGGKNGCRACGTGRPWAKS